MSQSSLFTLALALLLTALPTVELSAEARAHDDAQGVGIRRSEVPLMASDIAAEQLTLGNGLRVTLFDAEVLEARLSQINGESIIPIDGNRYLSVVTDINDPAIYNRGDGRFHPFPRDMVIDVLETIDHPAMAIGVTVYILPYPRRSLMVSSTSGMEVFLSPHVLDIHPATCAYIVAHELGHVMHNQYLPDGARAWNEYRRVRGITDTYKFNETSTHAYQPKEIFAEDFRVLFGGEIAAFGGRIENPELPNPASVPGLHAFFQALGTGLATTEPRVFASNYPNPFNPDTQIRIHVPAHIVASGERVNVRIYDVRGALVRELFAGPASSGQIQVHWNGTNASGNPVASAYYYALIQAGQARTTLKLVLLK